MEWWEVLLLLVGITMTTTSRWRWPHFGFSEMACRGDRCCGGVYACKPELMDAP